MTNSLLSFGKNESNENMTYKDIIFWKKEKPFLNFL